MKFTDQWATDEKDNKFIFTVEMQKLLSERGDDVSVEAWLDYKKNNAPKAAPDPKKKRERKAEQQAEKSSEEQVERSIEPEIDPLTEKFIGRLISFDDRKGFGFIAHGDEDIYFHRKKALDDPNYFSKGQKLLYTVNLYRGKEEAIDIEEYEEPIE